MEKQEQLGRRLRILMEERELNYEALGKLLGMKASGSRRRASPRRWRSVWG